LLALLPMAIWGGPAIASFACHAVRDHRRRQFVDLHRCAILLFLGARRWRRKTEEGGVRTAEQGIATSGIDVAIRSLGAGGKNAI
jgi:hypothetical protein